ncbi:unnamed protein product [Bursaphelenchus okinawaensis]|uniref:GH18 domain-containing protein n=1 Tax=Bursaphelenchus okinawaensis TaxID=465554 RepID=A0A811KI25_9BILA|nr:unnamed protein product [Bursaphelenchus okinawaensis]CAG9103481.1 unnamed protein product [Bursaphelenchus okinawaensis]
MKFSPWPTIVAIGILSLTSAITTSDSAKCAFYCFTFPQQNQTLSSLNKTLAAVPSLGCTHLVYGYAFTDENGRVKNPTENDIVLDSYYGNYKNLRGLKQGKNKVKTLLAVREAPGTNFIDQSYVQDLAITNMINLAKENSFDGIFLDLIQPTLSSFHFTRFLSELKQHISKDFILTLSVDASAVIRSADQLKKLEDSVSNFYIKADNVVGASSDAETLLLTPIETGGVIQEEVTLDYVADRLDAVLLERNKIVMGLSSWGRGYTMEEPQKAGVLVDTASFAKKGNSTSSDGRFAYQDMCHLFKKENYRYEQTMGAVWFVGNNANWYSLLPPKHKVVDQVLTWISNRHYSGVGIVQLEADDPENECKDNSYPLHRYINHKFQCAPREEVRGNTSPCNRFCTFRSYLKDVTVEFEKFQPEWCSYYIISTVDFGITGTIKQDDNFDAVFKQFNEWSAKVKPNLLVSIGDTVDSKTWKFVMRSDVARRDLLRNIQQLYDHRNIDGIVLSWTQGSMGGKGKPDSVAFHKFVKELKETLPKAIIIVTGTMEGTMSKDYDIPLLNRTVDYMLIEMFRFHDSSDTVTGHPSPLLSNSELLNDSEKTVEGLANEWVSLGLPRSKIVPQFTAQVMYQGLANEIDWRTDRIIGQSSNPAKVVKHRSREIMSQTELCQILSSNDTHSEFLPELAVPTAVKGNEFYAYDDIRSMKVKSIWSSLNQFGGIALSGLEMDNIQGQCPAGRAYPILRTIVDSQTCDMCLKEREPETFKKPECVGVPFRVVCSYRLPDANDVKSPLAPEDIPFKDCSEVVVEEIQLNSQGSLSFRDSTTEEKMNVLKSLDRMGKKLIGAIRCNMSSDEFAKLLTNLELIEDNIEKYLDTYGLDGIELRCDDMLTTDTQKKFSNLLRSLVNNSHSKKNRTKRQCPWTTSIRIPVWQTDLGTFYDVPTLKHLHHVALEPFQVENNKTQLISPLFSTESKSFTENSIDNTLKAWIKSGVPKSKILLHIPAYGIKQKMSKPAAADQELGAQVQGQVRVLTQAEVCKTIATPGVQNHMMFDMVATFSTTPALEFVTYETQQTIHYKIKYAVREQLAGVGLLTINEDDHGDICRRGKFPLLKEVHAAVC